MNDSTREISPLRQRMLEDMRLRKLAPHTQDAYVRSVRRLAGFLRRSPDTATVEDLRNFQLHLVDHGTSPITLNATITGLKFFFEVTLDRAELMTKMKPVFVPQTLPVVLSREEVRALIAATRNLKHQTALSVAYGAGLRASEVITLKVGDIDSTRMTLRIEQGKGGKDRGSALTHHPHVHGIVPGGGRALDADRWVPCKPGFFLSVRVLSRLFRRRFLEELHNLHRDGQLKFFGEDRRRSRAAASAAPCRYRQPRHNRLPQAHLRMPTLRRPDACHRDLRTRTAHPRTAGFTESTMSIRSSSGKSSPSALHRNRLTRTPIVMAADIQRPCTPQSPKSGSCRPDIASRGAVAVALVPPSSFQSPLPPFKSP